MRSVAFRMRTTPEESTQTKRFRCRTKTGKRTGDRGFGVKASVSLAGVWACGLRVVLGDER